MRASVSGLWGPTLGVWPAPQSRNGQTETAPECEPGLEVPAEKQFAQEQVPVPVPLHALPAGLYNLAPGKSGLRQHFTGRLPRCGLSSGQTGLGGELHRWAVPGRTVLITPCLPHPGLGNQPAEVFSSPALYITSNDAFLGRAVRIKIFYTEHRGLQGTNLMAVKVLMK